ncbi:hypothetical protein HQ544_05105 [Candidatus Falkowbacteria bacterium]|nr:hypothetical protein [Candidatus Falkowbacteria bacterium]
MPNEKQQFNNVPEYEWDIEKLRRLARRIKDYEDQELKEEIITEKCQ